MIGSACCFFCPRRGPTHGSRRGGAFSAPVLREFRTTLSDPVDDEQWRDAFRAAAYEPSLAERYIVKLKAKIQEGLAVR